MCDAASMGGSRGGGQGVRTPPWNCQIIDFCPVEILRQTPSGNLDPPTEKIFWIRACASICDVRNFVASWVYRVDRGLKLLDFKYWVDKICKIQPVICDSTNGHHNFDGEIFFHGKKYSQLL